MPVIATNLGGTMELACHGGHGMNELQTIKWVVLVALLGTMIVAPVCNREAQLLSTSMDRYVSGSDASDVSIPASSLDEWTHLSSANGDLPAPSNSTQQTSALILDVDKDGTEDFVIGCRQAAPAMVWYQRSSDGWAKYVIDDSVLSIEAGGAFHDIDGDGDEDIVMGGDSQSNKVWWWENPYPQYDPDTPWMRREIKSSGSSKHHDQIFGDFDGDGQAELAFWNQGAKKLFIAEIPADPRGTQPWIYTEIYSWDSGSEHEGLAKIDVDGDGKIDIVGGGRWFEHQGGTSYTPHTVDDSQKFARAAAGQLKAGGRPEMVFVTGDAVGPLEWYEWDGDAWVGRDLLGFNVDHGHSLTVADVDGDENLDIFCAEMRLDGGNSDAKMWVFLGDGSGDFTQVEIATGYGNHESRVGDLDGDGDQDILGKPYNWDTPRVDIWLNGSSGLPLDSWERHVIDPERPWRSIFITAADVNGDAQPDIVTGGWWYENPGSPSGAWVRRAMGTSLNNMAAVHDFDGDGDVDVLGTEGKGSESNPNFVWARNDGSGTFTILGNIDAGDGDFLQGVAVASFQSSGMEVALSWHAAGKGVQRLTVPSDPSSGMWTRDQISPISQDEALSAGDIDGDGDADILLGTRWLRNDEAGWTAYALSDASGDPDRNRLSDINADGRLDAVVGFEAISALGKLAWYEQGDSPTSLWVEHVIAEVVGPMSLDVVDMDSDGDPDVVVGEHNLEEPSAARMLVFENSDGQGTAWIDHTVYVGDEHHDGAQTVDVDGDGDYDIISTGWGHDDVVLYENRAISNGATPEVATPTISPNGGSFAEPVTVTLSTTTPEAEITYTLDGSIPVSTSMLYTDPFVLSTSAEVRARAFRSGYEESSVANASFTITAGGARVTAGERVLYTFEETTGSLVHDISRVGDPLNLTIGDLAATQWSSGALSIQAPTRVESSEAAAKVIGACEETDEISIEAWIRPANTTQDGPARIVSLSEDTLSRNFTLGQNGNLYEVRLRTTETSDNGTPSLATPSGSLTAELSHVVYTRDGNGTARIYINGVEEAIGTAGGDLSNWDGSYHLTLANELTGDRPWLGDLHLIAIFDRALSRDEVIQNYEAGPGAVPHLGFRIWLPIILRDS